MGQPQPLHAIQDHLDGLIGGALPVGIFDAQDEAPTLAACVEPAEQRRADATNVQQSRGLGAKRVTVVMEGAMLSAHYPRIATWTIDAYTCALVWRAVSSVVEHCFHTAGVTGQALYRHHCRVEDWRV